MPFDFRQYSTFTKAYANSPDKGLTFCEKKLKKDPNNNIYLLAKIDFLWRLKRLDESLKAIDDLKVPPDIQGDPNFLQEIQYIYIQCQLSNGTFRYAIGPKLLALWKQTLEKVPLKDRERAAKQDLLDAAWRDQCWDLAQMLFNQLQRDFKDRPDFHFAWIASTYLYASMLPKDDQIAGSLKRLATMSLSKIIDNTIKDADTPRKISQPRYYRLMYEILSADGRWDELHRYLTSPDLQIPEGMAPDITRGRLQTLQQLGKRKELYNYAYEQLGQYRDALLEQSLESNQGHRSGTNGNIQPSKKRDSDGNPKVDILQNDWQLWKSLIDSQQGKPTSEDAHAKIHQLLQDIIQANPDERAANRSLLMWNNKFNKTELIDILITSFSQYSTSRPCFDDLKVFLENISHQDEARFLDHIDAEAKKHYPFDDDKQFTDLNKAKNWVMINVNALKFEYFLCISKVPLPTKESLEAFVSDSLRMYKIALGISRECGEEACILAVMALVKLNDFSRDHELDENDPANRSPGGTPAKKVPPQCYLIQAICLLQFLRHNSPYNYSAALLSLLICQMLNLTSLAGIAITSLNVKEVQHDTIAHLFWSRISIAHPFDSSPKLSHLASDPSTYTTPTVSLKAAFDWFGKASKSTAQTATKSIEDTAFDKFLEFNTFRQKIDRSFSMRMYFLEMRRLEFMKDGTNTLRQKTSVPNDFLVGIEDNRDFKTIPNFEYRKSDSFDKYVTTKPKPMQYWLARHAINDITITLLVHKAPLDSYMPTLLSTLTSYLATNASDMPYQLTAAEQHLSPAWDTLTHLAAFLVLGASSPLASTDVKADLAHLHTHLSALAFTRPPPHDLIPCADAIHALFLRFELLKAASLFAKAALSTPRNKPTFNAAALKAVPADAVRRLADVVASSYRALHEHAVAWRARVRKEGHGTVAQLLAATVTGEDVAELVGGEEAWCRDRCVGDVVDSAVDALDGLVKVSI